MCIIHIRDLPIEKIHRLETKRKVYPFYLVIQLNQWFVIGATLSRTGGSGSVFGSEYQSTGITSEPSGPIHFSFFSLFSNRSHASFSTPTFVHSKLQSGGAHFEIFNKKNSLTYKDKNISNYRYIGSSILMIYRIYWQIFWHKILIDLKLIKTYENIKQNSYKWN